MLMSFAVLWKIHLHLAELQAFEKAIHICSVRAYLISALNDLKDCLVF